MKLVYEKSFLKSLRRLHLHERERVQHALLVFQKDPFHPSLHNHRLAGKRKGIRAISAGFALRILYREEGYHFVVFLLETGRHSQVY